jgi:hypothetical protein
MAASLSILVAAAAVIPATAVEPAGWSTSKEHPKTALMVAERGPIACMIDVSPDGAALRCTTQGQTDLDKMCELVMKHARFLPGEGRSGQAGIRSP